MRVENITGVRDDVETIMISSYGRKQEGNELVVGPGVVSFHLIKYA